MSRVLVTGGTGVLGREVVAQLAAADADVRVLTRRPEGRAPAGATAVRGDLTTGEGLNRALDGAEAVVHCASDSRRPGSDLEGTRRLLDTAREAGSPHIVDVSIVGVDRVLFGYYHAKLACESYVASSGLPWTIQRATQFHDLVLMALGMLARGPVASVPKGLRVQPVDAVAVAEQVARLALGGPVGRAPDLGGPRVELAGELMRAYLAATGRPARIVGMPLAGRAAAGFRAGGHLLDDAGRTVGGTFEEFLRSRTETDGSVQQSYALRDYLGRFPAARR